MVRATTVLILLAAKYKCRFPSNVIHSVGRRLAFGGNVGDDILAVLADRGAYLIVIGKWKYKIAFQALKPPVYVGSRAFYQVHSAALRAPVVGISGQYPLSVAWISSHRFAFLRPGPTAGSGVP